MQNRVQACIARLRALQASGKLSLVERELLAEVIAELEAATKKIARYRKAVRSKAWIVLQTVISRVAWLVLLKGKGHHD